MIHQTNNIINLLLAIPAFTVRLSMHNAQALQRMYRATSEFYGQAGFAACLESAIGGCVHSLLIQPWEYGSHLILDKAHALIYIHGDYTSLVWDPVNRTISVDQEEQAKCWDNGNGGYFATQPGTAIGRFMGQGFIPENLASNVDHAWHSDESLPGDNFIDLEQLVIFDNGDTIAYDQAWNEVLVIGDCVWKDRS